MTVIYRRRSRLYAACLVAGALLAWPATIIRGAGPQTAPPPAPPKREAPPPILPSLYRLSQGDAIEVRLFFNPELNEQVTIRPDGHVSLSLLGDLEIGGKTIPEAVAMLEPLYAKEVRTPRVVIQVRGFAGQKVFVTGEVMRPGLINLPGPMTVFEAISEAGGAKITGNSKVAVLVRKRADGLPQGYRLTLSEHGALTAQASTILGDYGVVMVPESKTSRVDRWVDQNIRQLLPINLSAGFSYVLAKQTVPIATIPILP